MVLYAFPLVLIIVTCVIEMALVACMMAWAAPLTPTPSLDGARCSAEAAVAILATHFAQTPSFFLQTPLYSYVNPNTQLGSNPISFLWIPLYSYINPNTQLAPNHIFFSLSNDIPIKIQVHNWLQLHLLFLWVPSFSYINSNAQLASEKWLATSGSSSRWYLIVYSGWNEVSPISHAQPCDKNATIY